MTFNDHEGSTKSYAYMKDHDEPLHELDFVPAYEDISVEIEEGEVREVDLHDGSRIVLKKLGRDYDPTDKMRAIQTLHEAVRERPRRHRPSLPGHRPAHLHRPAEPGR